MKTPFNWFKVRRTFLGKGVFVVETNGAQKLEDGEDISDYQTYAKKFIDDAIQEKLNRETDGFPIRGTATATAPIEKSPACNYCQHPENYPAGEVSRHTH